jgi:O-antigen/teichoic acid export membrane protein
VSKEHPTEEPQHDHASEVSLPSWKNAKPVKHAADQKTPSRSFIRKPFDTLMDNPGYGQRADALHHSVPGDVLYRYDTIRYPVVQSSGNASEGRLLSYFYEIEDGQESAQSLSDSADEHTQIVPSFPGLDTSQSHSIQPSPPFLNDHRLKPKMINLIDMDEELPNLSLSLLDTISMVAIQPQEELSQQQAIFINNQVEDIALRGTLKLPAIQLTPVQGGLAVAQSMEKQQIVTKTAGGAAIAGIADIISSILRYIITIVMTHMVSPAIYGVFVESNTVVTILGYASKLGLDSVQLRFLATYRAKGERAKAAGLIIFALSIALVFGLISAALFFGGSGLLAHVVFHKNSYVLPFREMTLLVPLIGMQLVLAAGLQALKLIKRKVLVDRLIQPCLTLVLLVVFYMLGLRLEALIFSTVVGYLASVVIGYFLFQKSKQKLVQGVKPAFAPRVWMRFAFPMFFNSMIRNILNSTDVIFLGIFATTSQLGFYGAADRMSYFVVAPLIALNTIFSPIIAELHVKGQHKQLENMFKLVTKWSISLSWPVFLSCVVFHQAIMGVFGAKYIVAGLPLIILGFGNLVDAGVGSVNYLLVMTGRPRVILANTVSTVIVNIILAFLLTPRFGIIGAAIAAALTLVILNIVGLIEVFWIMHIHPYRLDILKPLVAGVGASIVGWLLNRVIQVGYGHFAIFGVLALVLPFALVYILILILLRFSEEDKMVLNTIRAKFAKQKAA